MAYDYKTAYREFYLPKERPGIVTVPAMNYIAVRGRGDPNEERGSYQRAVSLLYGVAYTIKMSKRSERRIEGYFDFVVPPLEGFWVQDGVSGVDRERKADFRWISLIRLPDFVTGADLAWAVEEAGKKKNDDFSSVEFLHCCEGLCVQCLHIGTFDTEADTVERMHRFAEERGYAPDLSESRMHHEIYLSDPRKVSPDKLKTVIRHPIREAQR